MMRSIARAAAPVALLACAACPSGAQSLARRIESAPAGAVQFHFAARAGVCGDGRTYMRLDNDSWIGSFNDHTRSLPCEAGPARIVVVRAGGETIRIETFAGTLATDSTATDLGRVPAAEASSYLLSLAQRGEGRVTREALQGAALADSTDLSPALLAIVRDQSRSRELRRSAMSWLVRRRGSAGGTAVAEVVRVLTAIARDESEQQSTRQAAVSHLARLDRGEGIGAVTALATQGADPWLAKEATQGLGRSGDPRGRRTIRDLASSESTPAEVRVAAFSALVGEFGTAADAEVVRKAYPGLTSDRTRDAALGAVASLGGPQARAWLAGIARDRDQAVRQRKRAAELLDRAGAPTAELVRLYDEVDDAEVRGALISQIAQNGTRDGTTKLLAIARDEQNLTLRRRAVNVLARLDDPRVREALQELVERR